MQRSEAIDYYLHGQCYYLALALYKEYDFGLGILYCDHGGDWGTQPEHVFVQNKTGDGQILDICGWRQWQDIRTYAANYHHLGWEDVFLRWDTTEEDVTSYMGGLGPFAAQSPAELKLALQISKHYLLKDIHHGLQKMHS